MLECGLKNVNSKYAQMAVLTNKGILITLFLLLTLGSQCSLGALWSYGRSAFGFPEAPMSFFSRGKALIFLMRNL